jgi:hypothetical protein
VKGKQSFRLVSLLFDDTKVRAKSEEEEEEGCKCEHAKKIFFLNDSRTNKKRRRGDTR